MTCASAEPETVRGVTRRSGAVWGPARGERLYAVTPGEPGVEAWVEALQRSGDAVIVTLVLADGTDGRSVVTGDCADWLDLRPGQIVTVAATSAGDP
jgi:hypothetical protein